MAHELTKLSLIEQSKFTTDKPDVVRLKLRKLLESGEIRLKDIERKISFSSSTISQGLSDKYEGDVEKLNDALTRFYRWWIASHAVVVTDVLEKIQATMMLAWKRKEIASIVGPFGRGKSKAASHFVAMNPFAVYIELPSITSVSSFLNAMGDSLNIKDTLSGSQHDKLMSIVRSLQRTPRMLVIDEADNLRPRTLAILKDIWGDESVERCSIVLIGTAQLKKVLQHPDLGYLNRRIRIKRQIEDISLKEAQEIADMWPHDLDHDDMKHMWNWSLARFGVASLVALMTRGYDEMQLSSKKEIDSDCLSGAYGWLID